MRFYEISSGLRLPIDGEQQAILDRAVEAGSVRPDDLDERDAQVASTLVSRGILLLKHDDKGTVFLPNGAHDLWRM
jgi:hypothetical protein